MPQWLGRATIRRHRQGHMRLERLEISGFKSFSDRSELAFDEGVTAIVGPNGCGKSNVADAITWVLGEQSAKSLRGEKMEDVIFNGSDARKPGATAEVRLRLTGLPMPPSRRRSTTVELRNSTPANGDGERQRHATMATATRTARHRRRARRSTSWRAFTRDVEVTRRLYRSGESEYLIDGEVCRLRDVHELLMDTGLGAKAYAIIEQGKIGMILSSRPADRRQLIEEAAGITKYKSRRRAAELKLEAAQQNLTRIDDIVFEVEKQRGTLKRQAAKARRYKRLREELRRWEKVLFARRYRELAQSIEAARTRLGRGARARGGGGRPRLAEVEADLGRLRIEQAEADSRASRIREDAHARELDINRRQQQQEFNRHQAETLGGRAPPRSPTRSAISRRGASRRGSRSSRAARRRAEAERARDEAAAVLAEASDAHAAAQQQIEGARDRRRDGARRGLRGAELGHGAAPRDAARRVAARARGRDARQARRRAATICAASVEKVEPSAPRPPRRTRRAQEALERVTLERAARESELATARGEHEWRARDVRTREQELAGIEARLASLEELAASRAEFGDAARMVLVQANGHVGQQGAVADYLDVDSRYERAVEAVPRRPAAARHRRAPRPGGRRPVARARARRRPLRLRRRRSGLERLSPARSAARCPASCPVADVLRDRRAARDHDPEGAARRLRRRELRPGGRVLARDVGAASPRWTATSCAGRTSCPAARRSSRAAFWRPGARSRSCASAWPSSARRWRGWSTRRRRSSWRLRRRRRAIAALHAEQHRQEKDDRRSRGAAGARGRGVGAAVAQGGRHRPRAPPGRGGARLARRRACRGRGVRSVRLQEEQRQADERFTEAQRRLSAARETVDELSAQGRRSAGAARRPASSVPRRSPPRSRGSRKARVELEQRIAARPPSSSRRRRGARGCCSRSPTASGRSTRTSARSMPCARSCASADDQAGRAAHEGRRAGRGHPRRTPRARRRFAPHASELEVARATAESDLGAPRADVRRRGAVHARRGARRRRADGSRQGEATPDAAAITRRGAGSRSRTRASRSPPPRLQGPTARARRLDERRGGDRRAQGEDRSARPGEHDGDRAVRRARERGTCS